MDLRVQLIQDHDEGESVAGLAEMYGVARRTVYKSRGMRRRAWPGSKPGTWVTLCCCAFSRTSIVSDWCSPANVYAPLTAPRRSRAPDIHYEQKPLPMSPVAQRVPHRWFRAATAGTISSQDGGFFNLAAFGEAGVV
jgi:hypothetical protein